MPNGRRLSANFRSTEYGYRYYDAVTGRWVSKDLIGERGGANLYGFEGNYCTCNFDMLGLQSAVPAFTHPNGGYYPEDLPFAPPSNYNPEKDFCPCHNVTSRKLLRTWIDSGLGLGYTVNGPLEDFLDIGGLIPFESNLPGLASSFLAVPGITSRQVDYKHAIYKKSVRIICYSKYGGYPYETGFSESEEEEIQEIPHQWKMA